VLWQDESMVFEQPKELNRIVYSSRYIRTTCWMLFPFFGFLVFGLAEDPVLRGESVVLSVIVATVASAVAVLIPVLLSLAFILNDYFRKRTLRIDEDGIHVQSSAEGEIPWEIVRSIQFEPAGEHDEFTKLTIRYVLATPIFRVRHGAPHRAGLWRRRLCSFSFVFADEHQCEAALSEFQRLKGVTAAPFCIEVGHPATPAYELSPFHCWLLALGIGSSIRGLVMLVNGGVFAGIIFTIVGTAACGIPVVIEKRMNRVA
jgi:hypothetical protein